MTVTDQIKIIDNKIKANQVQYDLDRLAAKISAYSSGGLRKYEYLTGEDLGYKPSIIEQAKFDYSPLGMSFSKAFKKHEVKSVARSKSDFNYDSNHTFFTFYKGYDDFDEMSLDSKYNKMKDSINFLLALKVSKQKKQKQNSKRSEL